MHINFKNNENLFHAMDIMRAAMPHLNTPAKNSVELLIKTGELLETASSLGKEGSLSACSTGNEPIDMEALLLHVQEVCNSTEKETVTMLLNFIKARKLYNTYQSYRGQFSGSLGENEPGTPSMMEFMMSQLPPEQKSTFDNLSMILNTVNFNGAL